MASQLLRIYLFGEPRFEFAGETLQFSAPPKTLPLLTYLLLHRRAPIARETLAAAFWPEADHDVAFANVRRHLHYLTKALPAAVPAAPWLLVNPKTVAWNPSARYWLDVEAFEAESSDADLRGAAVRLYGGELYERCAEDWIEFDRERLRTLQLSNLVQLAAGARERSSFIEALQYAQLMLTVDPWHEDALRTIVEMRMLLGDRTGAMAEYERFAARLKAELRTEPLRETAELYQRVRRSSDLPAAKSGAFKRQRTMVGRRNESAILRDEWERANRGEGRAVFVAGEAGIGKTTLLETLRESVPASARVLSGAPSADENLPYHAFAQIIRGALGYVKRASIPMAARKTLAPLVPELHSEPAAFDIAPSEDERLRLFEAVAELLETCASGAPVLIELEDLHWAGPATIELLRYLLLRLENAPVLFAATYREFEVERSHPLRALRRQLAKSRRVTNLALSALGREEVRALADSVLGRALESGVADRVYERTDGNPLFVIELLRELRESGEDRIPSSIVDIVRKRLARMSDAARVVLETAAIAGSFSSAELLVQVTGLREADLLAALDELIERHFLRQSRGEAEFAFAHEVIRDAVYREVRPAIARSTHARIGLALRDLHAETFADVAAHAAWHFQSGGMKSDAAAAYVVAAERAVALYGLEEACQYATKALENDPAPEQRFCAARALEFVYASKGERALQRRSLDEMLATSANLAPDRRAQALIRQADFCSGESSESESAALNELELFASGFSECSSAYLLRRGESLANRGDVAQAKEALNEALTGFVAAGDVQSALRCCGTLLELSLSAGESPDSALARIDGMDAALRALSDPRSEVWLEFARARALVYRNPGAAFDAGSRMLAQAELAGDVWMEALAHRMMGASAVRCLRIGEARMHLRRCEQLISLTSRSRDLAIVRTWQMLAEDACSNFSAAIAIGEDALDSARAAGAADLIVWAQLNLASIQARTGDRAASRSRIGDALRLADEHGFAGIRSGLLGLLGEMAIAEGSFEQGFALIEESTERTACDDPAVLVHLPVVLGLASAAARRDEEARTWAKAVRGRREVFESFYYHPHLYLWSAAQLLSLLGYADDARAFLLAARRRRDEIAETLDDAISRETFERFEVNRLIAAAEPAWIDDPLQALPISAARHTTLAG